ncbi:response regulator [Leptobacterium flavescens]|uniref:Response regulator n=1 Tax=Leptobacterium flavescens TaxID=472055 RepID=A0A6P0UH98_9FLAO|nr:LytTR family DNA-binding domain-containing protein [Leptobacterium flavescens]NER11840.1 response regulator [Leptobacterium flavescens]
MKVLVIEDEQAAAENLIYLLKDLEPNIQILATIDSVAGSISYFNRGTEADLVFMDIHLADGISFEIFETAKVETPIIFTTAYDEYALKAFKVNSIDYLLKPIDKEELKESIDKFKSRQSSLTPANEQLQNVLNFINTQQRNYKSTYLVQQRDTLIPVSVDEIAYFCIDTGVVKAVSFQNTSYVIDKKLEDIEEELDPRNFFRANRQYIVQRKAIENVQLYFNGKLILNTIPKSEEQIVISKVKAPQLKEWINSI